MMLAGPDFTIDTSALVVTFSVAAAELFAVLGSAVVGRCTRPVDERRRRRRSRQQSLVP
jgi:hypothetical protein